MSVNWKPISALPSSTMQLCLACALCRMHSTKHVHFAVCTQPNMCTLQYTLNQTCALCSIHSTKHLHFVVCSQPNMCTLRYALNQTCALCSMHSTKHVQFAVYTQPNMCSLQYTLNQTSPLNQTCEHWSRYMCLNHTNTFACVSTCWSMRHRSDVTTIHL